MKDQECQCFNNKCFLSFEENAGKAPKRWRVIFMQMFVGSKDKKG